MDHLLSGVSLRDVGTALLDLAMPRRCIVCRRPLALRERFICVDCQADFPFTHFWARSHNPMADKFNSLIQRDLDVASFSPREPYAFATALFFYNADSDYRRIPWHLKYEGGLAAGRHFARLLGAHLAASAQFADVDVVIPVPLHWTRRWRRGYNQAEVIARELADVLGAEFRKDILRRSRRTRSQVRLSLAGKAANVRGAFSVSNGFRKMGCPAGHLLLVDDTFTTGSTLNACRAVLRQAFPPPTRISVATLAYVSSE